MVEEEDRVIGPWLRIFQPPFFICDDEEEKGIFNFVQGVSRTSKGNAFYDFDYDRDELSLDEDIREIECLRCLNLKYRVYPNDIVISLRNFARSKGGVYFSYHKNELGGLGDIIRGPMGRRRGIIVVKPRLFVNMYNLGLEIPETFELGIDPKFLR